MRKTKRLTAFCLVLALWFGLSVDHRVAYAHGVGYRRPEIGALALEFFYSTGEVMAYQDFKVFSPDDPKVSFQSGRTDEFGRVAFVPVRSGDWRIEVRDDEGHRAEALVAVGGEFLNGDDISSSASAAASIPMGFDLFLRAVFGVSILFNIAAFVSFARRSKGGQTVAHK
jgi:nickel transport protein